MIGAALTNLLISLGGIALGLRATSLLIPRVHPIARLIASMVVAAIFVVTTLQVSAGYGVYDMGLGLLISLSPVGVFDLLKWWYRWGA